MKGASRKRWLPTAFGVLLIVSVFLSFHGTKQTIQIVGDEWGHAKADAPLLKSPRASELNDIIATNEITTATDLKRVNATNAKSSSGQSLLKELIPPNASIPIFAKGYSFAACLLIKDDNDILNEWIAYHYHVLNLRHIIIATDPSSLTSPSKLLEKWRHPPFSMTIEEWTDSNYMPKYFLEGNFDKVPSFLPSFIRENATASIWHNQGEGEDHANLTKEEIEADLLSINNHRFRQVTFVSHCFRTLKEQGRKWVAHIDTDEYMVVNPRLRIRPKAVTGVTLPDIPHAGSLLQFIHDMFQHYPKRLLPSCIMMPTLMFGATENNRNQTLLDLVPKQWDRERFETLRWSYHAEWKDMANGLQKAIVDVTTLSAKHPIFAQNMIKSVHQPLDNSYDDGTKSICRRMGLKPDIDAVRLFPLTINHYVGSYERYMARQDLRRNVKIYRQKAGVRNHIDDGWIQGWFQSFVARHGELAARQVLGEYFTR